MDGATWARFLAKTLSKTLLVAIPCMGTSMIWANESAKTPDHTAPAESKPEATSAEATTPAEPDKKSAESTPVPAAKNNPAFRYTDHYVHTWIKFPQVTGYPIGKIEDVPFLAPPGEATVLIFIASWCEPCQRMMEEFKKLEATYDGLHTQVVYVFAHDTKVDAEGFLKEFGLRKGIVADTDTLRSFHNPELPTIYVGDRRGWLIQRYIKSEPKHLSDLSAILKTLTAH